MTISTADSHNQQHSDKSVKVPIGKSGQLLSVTCLKEFFEQRAQEQELLDSRSTSPVAVKNCVTKTLVSQEDSICQDKAKELLLTTDSPQVSPTKVHFGDENSHMNNDLLRQQLRVDIQAIPSYEDLQSSLTPRGTNSKKASPPPLRRGSNESLLHRSAPARYTTPQYPRQNPLRSPRVATLSSSLGKLPTQTKGGGFSPRHRVSRISPRLAPTLSTTFDSPIHDKLTNDDWIGELPDVRKGVKRFNKKGTARIRAYLEKQNTPKPNLDIVRQSLKDFVKLEFDTILHNTTNEFVSDPLKTDNVGSPRSTMYMKYVLERIQTMGILTKSLLPVFKNMKTALIIFLEKKKSKTEWTMRLSNFLSYLIYYQSDLLKFMDEVDNNFDQDIASLIQLYIENKLFNFLREYTDKNSHLLLRPDLAEIHLDFHDALRIHFHRHYVWEPQDAIAKFTDIDMTLITKSFFSYDGLSLKSLSINKTSISTENLIASGIDIRKRFFTELLETFYSVQQGIVSVKEIEKEVEEILQNKDVPSKELLSLCVVPWKHFHEAIRLLYPGLQCGIATLPNENENRIHIDVEQDGNYRVIRSMTYTTYHLKKRSESSYIPDMKRPVGKIEFVWTVTPCHNEQGIKTWSGCIQIPKSISIKSSTSYEMKWKMLRALIDYVEVGDQLTVNKLPLIEDDMDAAKFNQEIYEKFDSSTEFVNYIQPSAFMLEFIIKNFCRESLLDQIRTIRGSHSQELNIDSLSESIWEELKINGQVLEPLIKRLLVFDEKLRRYLMIKSKRTEWTDKLLAYLKELLLSTKYAEYGIPVNKDLNTFLRIIEKDFKDNHMRQLILNVMCGRWESFHGRRDDAFQDRHIGEIMGTLKYIRDSSKFLKPTLMGMIEDFDHISKHAILSKTHIWIEPAEKASPISSIDVKQIVRCFMQYTRPIFDKVVVNGIEVNNEDLDGDVEKRQKEYFKRLLGTIYSQYAFKVTEQMLEEQAAYMVTYESSSDEIKKEASARIPCLDLLKLCANSCWMVADIFIRNLYELNNPPIKSNMIQGMELIIDISKDGDYSVEHRRSYGIYPRETPDNITSNRILKSECLAKIPFSWKLSPYIEKVKDKERLTTMGELQVMDVVMTSGTLAEYEAIILKALHDYHTDFRTIPNWEDCPKEPVLHMPLESCDGKRLPISSPRFVKRPKTPR